MGADVYLLEKTPERRQNNFDGIVYPEKGIHFPLYWAHASRKQASFNLLLVQS